MFPWQVSSTLSKPDLLHSPVDLFYKAFKYLGPNLLPIYDKAIMPGKMVQAQSLQLGPLRVNFEPLPFFQPFQNPHFHGDGHVADSHRGDIGAVAAEGLGDQASGIGKVDQQGPRSQFT
jgi:hypothetical protein